MAPMEIHDCHCAFKVYTHTWRFYPEAAAPNCYEIDVSTQHASDDIGHFIEFLRVCTKQNHYLIKSYYPLLSCAPGQCFWLSVLFSMQSAPGHTSASLF